MDREELKRRTKEFAHRCVKLALALPKSALGDHVRRPGTYIDLHQVAKDNSSKQEIGNNN